VIDPVLPAKGGTKSAEIRSKSAFANRDCPEKKVDESRIGAMISLFHYHRFEIPELEHSLQKLTTNLK
jgi:hypothetical protein